MTVARLDDYRQPEAGARPLPTNIEAEQAVLGAVLVNNAAFHAIGPKLVTEHFAEEHHRRIWTVITALIGDGKVATPITLKTFLGDHEVAPGMTVPHYLARLAADAVTVINAPDYASLVVDLHARRELIGLAGELAAQAYDPPAALPVDRLIDGIETGLTALRAKFAAAEKTRALAGDMALDLIATAEARRAGAEKRRGVSSGLPDFDRDVGGLCEGELVIVAGRPGMGKTILGTNLARAAAKAGAGTLLFSLEVPREQTTARILADLAYIHRRPLGFGAIMRGEYEDEDLWRLQDAQRRLAEIPLVVDCASRLTVAQIGSRARAERLRLERLGLRLGVVVIDYLKFVAASDRYQGQRHYEVGEISAGLKQLAKDLGLCVVLLAQLNRGVEGRPDKRPGLADLRESGDLEADADVVAFVYRDAYYLQQSPEYRKTDPETVARAIDAANDLELIIAKNRSGPLKTHHLWCDVACSKVSARDMGGA